MPLDMTINLDRLKSVRLKLRRGLVKLTMCSAVGLDERYIKNKNKLTHKLRLSDAYYTVQAPYQMVAFAPR